MITDTLNDLKEKIKDNLWFQFFKNEFKIETWIDFENKIEYVLKNLFLSVNYIKKIFSNGSLEETSLNYGTSLFNKDIEILSCA